MPSSSTNDQPLLLADTSPKAASPVAATVFALCFATATCAACVFVKLSPVSVLWLLAARAVGDTLFSFLGIAYLRWMRAESEEPALLWLGGLAPDLLARGASYFFYLLFWYLSVDYMSVGDAIAIAYSSPIIVIPLCHVVLGEPVRRDFGVLFSLIFAGVLCIAQPAGWFGADASSSIAPLGLIFGASGVLAAGVVTLLTRKSRAAHVLHVQQASGVCAALLCPLALLISALLPWGAPAPPTTAELPYVAAVALCAFAAMVSWKLAHDAAATAAEVQLIFMVEVPLGVFATYAVFDTALDGLDWLGCALILVGAALNVWMKDFGVRAKAAPHSDSDLEVGTKDFVAQRLGQSVGEDYHD